MVLESSPKFGGLPFSHDSWVWWLLAHVVTYPATMLGWFFFGEENAHFGIEETKFSLRHFMIVMLIARNDLLKRVEMNMKSTSNTQFAIEVNLPVSTVPHHGPLIYTSFLPTPQHLLSYMYAIISICVYKNFPRYKVIRMNFQKTWWYLHTPNKFHTRISKSLYKLSLTGSSLVVRLTSAWCGVGGRVWRSDGLMILQLEHRHVE